MKMTPIHTTHGLLTIFEGPDEGFDVGLSDGF